MLFFSSGFQAHLADFGMKRRIEKKSRKPKKNGLDLKLWSKQFRVKKIESSGANCAFGTVASVL